MSDYAETHVAPCYAKFWVEMQLSHLVYFTIGVASFSPMLCFGYVLTWSMYGAPLGQHDVRFLVDEYAFFFGDWSGGWHIMPDLLALFEDGIDIAAMKEAIPRMRDFSTFDPGTMLVASRTAITFQSLLAVLKSGLMYGNIIIEAAVRKHAVPTKGFAFLTMVKYGCTAEEFAKLHKALRADRQFVLHVVEKNGRALMSADSEFKADREVVLAAVRQDGLSLEYAASELKAEREFMLLAVRQQGCALQYAASELKADREVVLAAVRQDGLSLEYAASELKAEREFMLLAVRQQGCALQYAASELKADREVVLAAVCQDDCALKCAAYGFALKYADSELEADREVLVGAVRQVGRTWGSGYNLVFRSSADSLDKEGILVEARQLTPPSVEDYVYGRPSATE